MNIRVEVRNLDRLWAQDWSPGHLVSTSGGSDSINDVNSSDVEKA